MPSTNPHQVCADQLDRFPADMIKLQGFPDLFGKVFLMNFKCHSPKDFLARQK